MKAIHEACLTFLLHKKQKHRANGWGERTATSKSVHQMRTQSFFLSATSSSLRESSAARMFESQKKRDEAIRFSSPRPCHPCSVHDLKWFNGENICDLCDACLTAHAPLVGFVICSAANYLQTRLNIERLVTRVKTRSEIFHNEECA